MKWLKWFCMLVVMGLILLPAGSALAAPGNPVNPFDRIITGDDFVLDDGETERGNVVVFGGSAAIKEGAELEGDLTVFGGDVRVDGIVEGSVVVLGGDVDILDDAIVEGDCVLIGGSIEIDESALIEGDVVTNPNSGWFPFSGRVQDDWDWEWRGDEEGPRAPEITRVPVPEVPSIPPIPPRVITHHRPTFAGRVGGAFLSALGAGVLAMVIALFFPRNVDQVRQVIVREPVMSGLVGFLTMLAAGLLTPILLIISVVLIFICIGILGFPLVALLWLVILVAGLVGWTALGQLIGRWIAERINLQGASPILETGLGVFAVGLVLGIVTAIPLIGLAGGLLQFGIMCIGLGAVVLTRFGRQDYHQGQPIFPQRPPRPASPVAEKVPVETPVPPAPPTPSTPPASPDDEEESQFEAPPLESEGPFPEK